MKTEPNFLAVGIFLAAINAGFSQPLITQEPRSCTNALDTIAAFWGEATGTESLVYQWQKLNTNWGDLAGCTNANLCRTNVQTSHAGLGYDIPQTNRLIIESGDWIPSSEETQKALLAVQSFIETCPSPTNPFAEKDSAKEILKNTKGYGVRFTGKLREGRMVIVCNFFPAPKGDEKDHLEKLRQEGLWVDGGGSGYWQVDYDPSTGSCMNFTCNAPE